MTAFAIIDPALNGTSVPATYVAPGNLQNLGVGATVGSTSGSINANAAAAIGVGTDTYTVLAANCRPVGAGGASGIAGSFTQAGSAVAVFIPVGLYPTKIELNVGLTTTEVGFYQWMHGMGAYEISSLVGADEAELTTNAIVVVADSAGGDGNVCYVKFPAALVVASQVCSFRILS